MDKTLIWLVRGLQRKNFFMRVPKGPILSNKIRKQLNDKEKMNLSLREVSRHIRDFEKRGLIKCLNKSDPYNRFYELTTKGKKIQKEISKLKL